ncbi:MAG: GNAT family N-acetyltransferase [Alphaproteobacteria bacterium]
MGFIFETERIGFREWRAADRAEFARMNGDPLIMQYLPRSLNEAESDHLVDKFEAHFAAHGFGLYALERKEDGAFMGFTGLQHVPFDADFTPAVEIAWRLDYGFWGQGYGSEAAQAVLAHGVGELGLAEIVGFTVHDNARSIAVMAKIGMVRDVGGDFDYPGMRKDHPLGAFVLYRATT